jgi:hypothetical protein
MIKTIHVNVFRDSLGDCTNNGITSKHNSLTMFVDCSDQEALEYCKENNIDPNSCIILVRRMLWGERHDYAEPLIKPSGKVGPMMGGNFVYTCDSRMHDWAKSWLPIPVHDRYETQEEYDLLSM